MDFHKITLAVSSGQNLRTAAFAAMSIEEMLESALAEASGGAAEVGVVEIDVKIRNLGGELNLVIDSDTAINEEIYAAPAASFDVGEAAQALRAAIEGILEGG